MSTEKKEKKVKKKGPLRTGAIVPLIVVLGSIVAFSILLLDVVLKKSFEYGLSKINGAEVNITAVNTSFTNLSMEILKVEMTNPAMPEFNRIEVGFIRYKMLWDALLRAKIVIDETRVGDIKLDTKRKAPGHVPPPEPPSTSDGKMASQALEKAKEEFKGNVIGDIASVVSGGDGKKVAIEGELKSKAHLKKLEEELATKEASLKQALKDLPSEKEFKELEKRYQNIKWKDLGNIAKAPKVLKEADQLKKDLDKTLKSYKKTSDLVTNTFKDIKQETDKIEDLVKEDIADIGKRLKLPKLDPKSIAMNLMGPEMAEKLKKLTYYKSIVDKYLPPKKEREKDAGPVIVRSVGRDYRFGTPTSYPVFWLKLLSIDSKNDQGIVTGKMTNLTSNQKIVGAPTHLEVAADLPGANFRNAKLDAKIDHRDKVKDIVLASIGSFPVDKIKISEDKNTKFNIQKAIGSSDLSIKYDGKELKFNSDTALTKLDYEIESNDKTMQEILGQVAETTQRITMDAAAYGKPEALRWEFKSNLADSIKKSADRFVQKKIDAKKAEIKKQVDEQVAAKQREIKEKVAALENQFKQKVDESKKKLDQMMDKLNAEKKKATKGIKGFKL